MSDNDKNIAKEILLSMMDKGLGEFSQSSTNLPSSIKSDVIGKAYQAILKHVSNQEEGE